MRWQFSSMICTALVVLSACSTAPPPVLWTALPEEGLERFQSALEAYNQSRSQPVAWKNLAEEDIVASLPASAAEAPDWLMTTSEVARRLPPGTLKSWEGAISPRLITTLLPGFTKDDAGRPQHVMLPLAANLTMMVANYDLADAGMGRLPVTIGDIGDNGKEFRRKTGKYLFMPAFGNPEYVLATVASHGTTFVDEAGKPKLDVVMAQRALTYWATLIKEDVIPRDCLSMTEEEGIRRFANEETAAVFASTRMAKTFYEGKKPSFKISWLRYPSGAKEMPPVSVTGLFRVKSGAMTADAQNLAAFLLSDKGQWAVAETTLGAPCVAKTVYDEANGYQPEGLARQYLWQASFNFIQSVSPLLPLESKHDALAAGMRQALIAMVDGMPAENAMRLVTDRY